MSKKASEQHMRRHDAERLNEEDRKKNLSSKIAALIFIGTIQDQGERRKSVIAIFATWSTTLFADLLIQTREKWGLLTNKYLISCTHEEIT